MTSEVDFVVELENVHLNEITRFDFAEVIRQSIPATRQVLQDSVVADLQTWLLKIREKSKQIGELAFRHTEKKREEWRQISEQDTILSSATFNSALERIYCEQDNCAYPLKASANGQSIHLIARISQLTFARCSRLCISIAV